MTRDGLCLGRVVGFFVVPVIGLLLGFVIGVFLAESARLRDRAQAWTATRVAIRAALTSVGIELAAAVTIAVGWAPAGSNSDRITKRRPPSSFSRGRDCSGSSAVGALVLLWAMPGNLSDGSRVGIRGGECKGRAAPRGRPC